MKTQHPPEMTSPAAEGVQRPFGTLLEGLAVSPNGDAEQPLLFLTVFYSTCLLAQEA